MHVSIEVEQVIDKSIVKSIKIGVKSCFAFKYCGENFKSFARIDDACVSGIDTAIKKIKTVSCFIKSSGEIGILSVPAFPHYSIKYSNDGLVKVVLTNILSGNNSWRFA